MFGKNRMPRYDLSRLSADQLDTLHHHSIIQRDEFVAMVKAVEKEMAKRSAAIHTARLRRV